MLKLRNIHIALLLFAGGILDCKLALSQSSSPDNTSTQQEAMLILNSAEAAMGGIQAWSAVGDSTAIGTCTAASLSGDSSQQSYSFRWIFAKHEFRLEAGTAAGSSTVILSGHGKPQAFDTGGTKALTSESFALTRPFHLPGEVLATVLSDSQFHALIVGNEELNGSSLVHIRVLRKLVHSDETGSAQDWWFDSTSHLPLKVTFKLPGQEIRSYLPITYSFTSWNTIGGLAVPSVISESIYPELPLQTCTVEEFEVNSQPSSSLFDAR